MAERARVGLSREAVIHTAIACMAGEGTSALGINRVARALGIRPPSLYHYVRSNKDLHLAVALQGWRTLIARLRDVVLSLDELTEEPTTKEELRALLGMRIRAVMHAFRAFAEENPALHQTMSITVLEQGDSYTMELKQAMVELFGEILAPFHLDATMMIHCVRSVRSAIHGFLLLNQAGQFPLEDVEVEQTFELMVDMIVCGVMGRLQPPD